MTAVSPLHAAISAHRAAYDAFQVAPEGEDSELASCDMLDALDSLVVAACAFPILGRQPPEGAGALLAHLQWWLTDEAGNAADYQPNYGILLGRASDLAAVIARADDPDPIFSLIEAADAAAAAHTVACRDLDEDDDAQMRACNQAAADAQDALTAIKQAMPVTVDGLHALAAFYVRDAELYDRDGESIGHLARALIACESAGRFSAIRQQNAEPYQTPETLIPPGGKRGGSDVPGQAQVEAAWHRLAGETQDRIGIIATDMVFQAFVHGDAFVATGQPKDRAVPKRSKAHQAIRDAAGDAETERLNELHRVVEAAIPTLFGPDGQNPDWAVAMGARR